MKVFLNKPGKWVITVAVLLSFLFGTLVENRLQVMQNLQNAVVENVNGVIVPEGKKLKERFDRYYKEAEKTYEALKIGTVLSLAIVLSSLPRTNNRGP